MQKHLKHAIAALAVLAFLAVPAFARGAPTEVAGSLTWQNGSETGRTWSAQFDLAGAIAKDVIGIGPVLRAQYFSSDVNPDPNDTGSLTLYQIGGQFVLWTTKSHNGAHVGVDLLYLSNDVSGYLVEPFVGLEFGSQAAFFRARLTHPLHYGRDGDTIDLERNEVAAAFGMRF